MSAELRLELLGVPGTKAELRLRPEKVFGSVEDALRLSDELLDAPKFGGLLGFVEPKGDRSQQAKETPSAFDAALWPKAPMHGRTLRCAYRWIPWRPLIPWWDVEWRESNPFQLVLLVGSDQSAPALARAHPSHGHPQRPGHDVSRRSREDGRQGGVGRAQAQRAKPGTGWAPRLRYAYDASDQRVVKQAVDAQSQSSFTLYVFESLELRRTQWDGSDYEADAWTVVPYLLANGIRLARVVYDPDADPTASQSSGQAGFVSQSSAAAGNLHVFFELGDHLGSTSVVLDKATGELVERATFQAYGGTESDYRPERWKAFREDYRFTGKEEDVEVGLQYFGKRYLNPLLGRWISADPLAIHSPGEADLNVYAYVSGAVLKNVDPLGLQEENASEGGEDVQLSESDWSPEEAALLASAEADKKVFEEEFKNDPAYSDAHLEERFRLHTGMGTDEGRIKREIEQMQPEAVPHFFTFAAEARVTARAAGYEFVANGSFRTEHHQASQGKEPGRSCHNNGCAMDFNLRNNSTGETIALDSATLSAEQAAIMDDVARVAIGQGLKPGSEFKTRHPEHFEYTTGKTYEAIRDAVGSGRDPYSGGSSRFPMQDQVLKGSERVSPEHGYSRTGPGAVPITDPRSAAP